MEDLPCKKNYCRHYRKNLSNHCKQYRWPHKFCTEYIAAPKEPVAKLQMETEQERHLDLIARQDVINSKLRDLIWHVWVHSGYEDCGYKQMTGEQKELFDSVIGRESSS